jgi:hypothetical protein
MTLPKQPTANFSLLLILFTLWLLTSCNDNDSNEVQLFEPGKMEASSSTNAVMAGEKITFTDMSTKVHIRSWNFPGGTPSISTDSIVTVTYVKGGDFTALLKVTFIDNINRTQEFPITVTEIVEEEEEEENNEPEITGATYGVFTEYSNVTPGKPIWFVNSNAFINKKLTDDPYEGQTAQSFIVDGTGPGADKTWAMGIIQAKDGVKVDLSQFVNGYLNVALKSISTGAIKIRIRGTGLDASLPLTSEGKEYGFERDGKWHMLSIPLADIMKAIPEANRATALSQVNDLLILRSGDGVNVSTLGNYNFDVDNVFYSENLPKY